jgi:hypothetical protein
MVREIAGNFISTPRPGSQKKSADQAENQIGAVVSFKTKGSEYANSKL